MVGRSGLCCQVMWPEAPPLGRAVSAFTIHRDARAGFWGGVLEGWEWEVCQFFLSVWSNRKCQSSSDLFTKGQFLIGKLNQLPSPKSLLAKEFPLSCGFMERASGGCCRVSPYSQSLRSGSPSSKLENQAGKLSCYPAELID